MTSPSGPIMIRLPKGAPDPKANKKAEPKPRKAKVDNTTWGKNGEGWFWVLAGFGIGFLILAAFLDAPGVLVVFPLVGGLLGLALRIIRSLKKEIAELKSGDADVSTAAQDSE